MTARAFRPICCSPEKAGGWRHVWAALLFAFYVNYIPAHVAAKMHYDGSMASLAEADFLHHDHDAGTHHHDCGHHKPHRASDHALTLWTASKASSASAHVLPFLPAGTHVLIPDPESNGSVPIFERSRPPGEWPHSPLQPRAPPLV